MKNPTLSFLMSSAIRGLIALTVVLALFTTTGTQTALAASFTVTKTADTNDGACDSDCSLREAIRAANLTTGADTITVPAGTYLITLSPGPDENASVSGDFDITDSVTIAGAGAATTIIDGQDADRVFDIAPINSCNCTVSFSDLTITNGRAYSSNFNVGGAIYIGFGVTASISNSTISSSTATATGAGIEARGASLTLTNVTLQSNDAIAGGGALRSIGNLTIYSSSFQNNEAEFGGAIALAQDSTKTISISGSTFSGNHTTTTAGGNTDDGGAIFADIDTTLVMTGNTFTGNSAVSNGGAIYFRDNATSGTGVLNASYNRIVGNTAASGGGLFLTSGTATAEKNWWGCNGGPSAGPCDLVWGTADFTPWIVLSHTATPNSVSAGQASTLTADFLKNSDASSNAASDLNALIGLAITFNNAVLGTLSNAQTTIQSNGTATVTYTAGSTSGTGSADATVDSQTLTANITITVPGTTVTSINRDGSSPTNAPSVSWTVIFADALSGLTASNFTLVNTGLGGSPGIGTVSPVGSAPATNWTVTASTGSGSGTLGLNLTNDTGLDQALNNLPFTGQVYTIDSAAPTVTMTSATSNPTNVSPIPVTVQFSENVTGFTVSDIITSGDITPTINNFVAVDGDTYTFDLVPIDPGGGCVESWFVAADIASGVAQDGAGNGNTAAVQFSRTFDDNPPCVGINQAAGQADPTGNSPIHFEVGFSQPVSGFGDSSGDVILSGTAGATNAVVTGGPTYYDVAVSGMTTDGTVVASIPANVAFDAAGNGNDASTSNDNTVTFFADSTPPDTTITNNPTNPSNSTSASFSFSGSDNRTPAASLTFECSLDGGSFTACTSPRPYSNLALGSHTFQVRAIDAAGNVDPTQASYTWQIHASTTLLYTGGQIVNVGSSLTLLAKLSSSAADCTTGQAIQFALDDNPTTAALMDGPYLLGTVNTNGSGIATLSIAGSTTAGWQEGIYTITASYAGTPVCDPSSDQATLTVASPGNAATGGGWYTLSGTGRINFGFTVRKADSKCTSNCTYKGQLLLINNGKWRLKGNLTSYSKTATGQGAASGTGDLYWWDPTLNGGLGDWALAQAGVSYTINFYDSGKSGKSSTDKLGIRIVYTPVSPQPATLPNSTPQLLKGGDIKVQ